MPRFPHLVASIIPGPGRWRRASVGGVRGVGGVGGVGALILLAAAPWAFAADPPASTPPRSEPQFAQVVRSRFQSWDSNHDGALSPAEVDQWTVDPQTKGDAAAAIATIKLAMRRKTDPIKTFTLAMIEGPAPKDPGATDVEEDDTAMKDPRTLSDLQKRYRASLRRIAQAQRTVFADDHPDLGSFHQGPLGDCYFVSMVGALAYHEPARLSGMLRPAADGSCAVQFPGQKTVDVPPLTDAQIAISSTAGKDGLWLPVVEQAFGLHRQSSRAAPQAGHESPPPDPRDDEPTDLIAHGGYAGTTIELLTGHDAARIGLGGVATKTPEPAKTGQPSKSGPPDKSGEPARPDSAAKTPKPLTDEQLQERAAKMRELLPGLLENKRLVSVGTAKEFKLPPGINPSHAYAILAFDPSTDRVTIWNPHGNSFKPKGPPGLEHGYPTRGGRFDMPLAEVARVFRGFVYETDRPAVPDKSRKPEKPSRS